MNISKRVMLCVYRVTLKLFNHEKDISKRREF